MLLAAAAFFAAGRVVHSANYWWVVTVVVVAAALFLIFRTVQLAPRAMPITVSSIIAVLMVIGMVGWTLRVAPPHRAAGPAGSFVAYSPDAFDAARAEHKIVLVKFTANWCATCQVIEGTVFSDPATWDDIRSHNVVAMKADFSKKNPAAQLLLDHLSTSGGIPLTAVYPPIPTESVATTIQP